MGKEKIKYALALEELEQILTDIQSGEIDVDDLSSKVKRAVELVKICKQKIEKTEMEVEKIVKSFEKVDSRNEGKTAETY